MEAIIFDMDGILVDSEGYNTEFSNQFFKKQGYEIPLKVSKSFLGTSPASFWKTFREIFPTADIEDLEKQMEVEKNRQQICYSDLVFPQLPQVLTRLNALGIPLAVASSTQVEKVKRILNESALNIYFTTIVGGDQVRNSKPHPEIFLKAADLLAVNPGDCIVVEDSENGVRAGIAAGMYVVGKRDQRFAQDISLAHTFFKDYNNFLDIVRQLL